MAKQAISIILYISELLYDIQNKTYLTGRARANGSNHEEVANMQANDDDENKNQILRSIGEAFATLKTKLSEFIVESATTANNIQIDDKTNLIVSLSMPSNYNTATRETIASALHQYIVNLCTSDWFVITNKADATEYVAGAAANLEQIREALNKRKCPIRVVPNS